MPRIRLVPGGQTTTLAATSAWNVEASGGTTKWIEYDDFKVLLDADKQYGCRLTEAGGQSIDASTWESVLWDTETFDHNNYHSVATNTSRITIPSGQKGVYIFGGISSFAADSSGTRQARIRLNDTTNLVQVDNLSPGASIQNKDLLVNIYLLDVADYIELQCWHNSTTDPLAIDITYSQFWAYMLTRVP